MTRRQAITTRKLPPTHPTLPTPPTPPFLSILSTLTIPSTLTILSILTILSLASCASPDSPSDDATIAAAPAEFPKIDFHAHYRYARPFLVELLDSLDMRANLVEVIHLGDEPGRTGWQAYKAHYNRYPDRFFLTASFDASRIDEPDFATSVIAQLEDDLAAGARAVKVWKEIGMGMKDASGAYIHIDDPRFQPIWDFLVSRGIPVLAHIGEPRAAWLPLDERSPHYGYYRDHPEYHAYQHPEIPRWEAIMAARDNWLAANPDLKVIGAHLGSMAYDVSEVARRLEAYPNFWVETSARFGDLALQPSDSVRAFFLAYQDRILYGTDLSTREPIEERSPEQLASEEQHLRRRYTLHMHYLSGADSLNFSDYGTSYDAPTRGLDLPRDVLEKVYFWNAIGLIGGGEAPRSAG